MVQTLSLGPAFFRFKKSMKLFCFFWTPHIGSANSKFVNRLRISEKKGKKDSSILDNTVCYEFTDKRKEYFTTGVNFLFKSIQNGFHLFCELVSEILKMVR